MSQEVSLLQVLQAREDRVRFQQELLREYHCPLICFTMNIAGPVKNSPLIQRGFQAGLQALDAQLPATFIRKRAITSAVTGCEAMYAVDMDAAQLKQICTAIEDGTPLGRLFDMDVLNEDGTKLERSGLRGCIVCGAPGRGCAARRVHPVSQLQTVTNEILQEHFRLSDAAKVAEIAVQSLLDEVHTTPKPGLVDRRNNGSHKDMDLPLFITSANVLRPYFQECVQIGQNTASKTPQETFSSLRQAGLNAEKAMYNATGGINTHKGIIYTMGILCGGIGRLWSAETPFAKTSAIVSQGACMAQSAMDADFAAADNSTAGLRLYKTHGIKGIRGEVASGLPSVMALSLPVYQERLKKGLSSNDAGVIALLHLIANIEDTNLLHRGGTAGAAWAASAAQNLLKTDRRSISAVELLDDQFIQKNLSPGGCADLLAVTYFLHSLDNFSNNLFTF